MILDDYILYVYIFPPESFLEKLSTWAVFKTPVGCLLYGVPGCTIHYIFVGDCHNPWDGKSS